MKVLLAVLVLFLSVNIGVIYYIIFLADFPDFTRRLDLVESRIDTYLSQAALEDDPEIVATSAASMVVLSPQQQETIAKSITRQVKRELAEDKLKEESGFETVSAPAVESQSSKVLYIPLGQATLKSLNQWKDAPVEVEIDTIDYGSVEYLTWEATLRVPTNNGQVKARLSDTASGAIIESEIAGEGESGVYVKSAPFTISEGRHTLKLQILTTLDYEGVVENAKVRITRQTDS